MNCNYYLYLHINTINTKKYIGITRQEPKYRWRSNGSGYYRSPHFYSSIKKYGWNNFKHIILQRNLSFQVAKDLEMLYITLLKTRDKENGYNMTDGGEGTLNVVVSQETRKKLSVVGKGKKRSEETKRKMSEARKGYKPTLETLEKLRISHLGHKPNENQLKGLKAGWGCGKKKIYCIDEEGNKHSFDSINEASQFYNIPSLNKNFKRIVKNHNKCGGMYWFYEED